MTTVTHLLPSPSQPGRVAVLLPVYRDDGVRLTRTLASLQNQGLAHTLVVIDDGSPTPVCIKPEDVVGPTVLIRLDHNAGIEGALNAGLAWARSAGFEYAARIDNGDLATAGRLARQAAFLDEHPDVVIVGGGAIWVSEHGDPLFQVRPPTSAAGLRRAARRSCPLIHPTVMFRIRAAAAVGDYRTDTPAAEDYDFFLRLMGHGGAAALPSVEVHTLFDARGLSHARRRRQLLSRFKVQRRYADWRTLRTYAGMGLTIALLMTPTRVVDAAKRLVDVLRRGHG